MPRRSSRCSRIWSSASGYAASSSWATAGREMANPQRTYVQEVASDEPGVRIFVAKSEERAGYESSQRLKAMERVRMQPEALKRRVEQGKLKAPDKIGAAAARTLGRYHGSRSYAWELKDRRVPLC